MQSLRIVIPIFLFVLLSCNDVKQNQIVKQNPANTKIDTILKKPHFHLPLDTTKFNICGTGMAYKIEEEKERNRDVSFASFWQPFLNDLVHKNYKGLSKKTKFPLKTKDTREYESVDEYKEGDFKKVFSSFLNQEMTLYGETRQERMKFYDAQPEIPYVSNSDSLIRVEDMVFEKIGTNWFLTTIYNKR